MTKAKASARNTWQFAETYEGCQVVANIMGLNVETVRKRAKAGKIPGKQNDRGTWVFQHHDLVVSKIEPFASHGCHVPHAVPASTQTPAKENFTDVIFVLDRSGSMAGLEHAVRDSLAAQLAELRKGSGVRDHYTVSVINFDTEVSTTMSRASLESLMGSGMMMGLYLQPRGGTALFDAIGHAIATAGLHNDGQRAFLVSVLTDGQENGSRRMCEADVVASIKSHMAGGRFTFAYAGPPGSQRYARSLGIPDGNVTTWEASVEGVRHLATASTGALATYATSRSMGVMRSESFYAQPVDSNAAGFAARLDGDLVDVTKRIQIERVTVNDPLKVSEFALAKFGAFKKGELYYELTESEKVQDYKGIIVQDLTKGQFFSGWTSAKRLLGIPEFRGTVRIRPGQLGEFKVFVQSTSVNRRLVPGTALVRMVP